MSVFGFLRRTGRNPGTHAATVALVPPIAGRAMSPRYRVLAPAELDEGLSRAWRKLQSRNDALASPYFCPTFIRIAAQVRPNVRVVVLEDSHRPVAFFPFERTTFGFGRPVCGSLSDYHGVVAQPGSEWSVPDLLRAANLRTWQFDHLVDLDGRFERYATWRSVSPQMDLRGGYEAYAHDRRVAGSDIVSQTERKARNLAREHGPVVFTLNDQSPAAWDCLFRWKSAQYRRTGMTNPFQFPWMPALLRRLCAVDEPEFGGVLSSLRVGERIVAVHMGMRSRTVLHWWFPAYDPVYARYSVGIILLLRIAKAATGAGIAILDLGKGEALYKQRSMTGATPLLEGSAERSPWMRPLAHARGLAVSIVRGIDGRLRPR
jgi:CelD/BcsL family acetyltransferase involved in cellulose biosynthesis